MPETFGCTSLDGKAATEFSQGIRACKFTSGSAGELDSISIYLVDVGVTVDVKCAIYNSSKNLMANGTTEIKQVTVGQDDWMTFNFEGTKPTVLASTVYWLAFFHSTSIKIYRGAGGSSQYAYRNIVWGDWPADFSGFSYGDYEAAIYATYYEAPPPVKTLVQAALISVPPLIVLPTLAEILKFTGGC